MSLRKHALVALMASAPLLAGCPKKSGDDGGPDEVEFGLDERPPNPTCLAPPRPPSDFSVQLAPAFPGLTFTRAVLVIPSPMVTTPQRWYVVGRNGSIFTFEEGDSAHTIAIAQTVTTNVASGGDERGLLGLAFHPDFASNGRAYIHYTNGNLTSQIEEIVSSDGGLTFTAPGNPILSVDQPYDNHNGGMIAFGPDGYLYIALGDGGSGGDPLGAGQDTGMLLGKILRIDVDSPGGTLDYGIPADNPFASSATERPEIYAWGFRNPWRFSFDTETGELWAADVGQSAYEEVNKVERGGNYGWDAREGFHCFEGNPPCTGGAMKDPVVEHAQPAYRSITGGYVYRGTAIPALAGRYVYGDYVTGQIHAVFENEVTGAPEARPVLSTGFNISSFGQGHDGEIYVINYGAGTVQKIVPAGAAPADAFPDRLSETGCFEPSDPRVPVAGLIPYDLNAPLWSDGAAKRRWMALPDGTTIDVDPATGDWTFPERTVLVKEFSIDGQRIETRLLVLHTDGNWAGYSYEWDDGETDATLLPAGKTRLVDGQVWGYPSRGECLQCHTDAAGRSLGLETRQLNRDAIYPGNLLADQLDTLEHIGMFSGTVDRLDALPAFDDTGTAVDLRARSYLHSNCSNCHRPGGTGQGPADFRYDTTLAEMSVCGVDPENGNLGVPGAQLLVPGEPDVSLISLRMKALDTNRMPDVGTRVVDPEGTALVDAWITGIASCP